MWYVQRARSMGAPELIHRVRERVQVARVVPDGPAPIRLRERPDLDIAAFSKLYGDSEQLLADIDSIVTSHRVQLLGRELSLDEPDWSRDPDGTHWPDLPWTKVGYRNLGTDPKYSWEMHRLLYLLPLVAAGRHAEDPRAARSLVERVLEDWARSTRPNRGIGWTSSIEVALRMLSLTVMSAAEDLDLSASTRTRMRDECSHGLRHLSDFPSRFSSANNHRVAELVGALIVGQAWGAPPKVGVESELAAVAASLFGRDGAPLEQSTTYGAVTLELLALATRLASWRDDEAKARVTEIVVRGADTLAEFIEPELGIIRYGDDDEWRILGTGLRESSWLECLAELLGRPLEPSVGLHVHDEGGVSVARVGPLTVTFDHGPLGFGTLAAHGHLDQLHVSVFADGISWVVDPGTYEYHGSRQWRDHFRSAESHNGPHLEDDVMCRPTGPFNWSADRPETSLVRADSTQTKVELCGITRSGTGEHAATCRTLEVSEDRVRISDSGPGGAVIVSRFILAPELEVHLLDDRTLRAVHADSEYQLTFSISEGRLAYQPDGAWVSRTYAQKCQAPLVELSSARPGHSIDVTLTLHTASHLGRS